MANIYVIDDDQEFLQIVSIMLESQEHAVTPFTDPAIGLERVKANKPDLLMVDVMMPRISGHEICRQVRANSDTAELPIIIVTARTQAVDRITAEESGANAFISKPINRQELLDRIDEILDEDSFEKDEHQAGFVISLFSLRGGVGRTTLAVNMAVALRNMGHEVVYLLDLSSSGGQAALHLRMKGNKSWENLLGLETLDWQALQAHLLSHESGLRLLAAPASPLSPSEPAKDVTSRMLELLSQNGSAVVVDLPAVLSPSVSAALASSDIVLHIVCPEVISLQSAMWANRILQNSIAESTTSSYWLNQVTPEAQVKPAIVEKALHTGPTVTIPYDDNQSPALARGLPLTLAAPQSPLAMAIQQAAEAITNRNAQSA
jgi:pilus assembly protein CpaE